VKKQSLNASLQWRLHEYDRETAIAASIAGGLADAWRRHSTSEPIVRGNLPTEELDKVWADVVARMTKAVVEALQ
jgi:hypothetical protein